MPPQQGENMTVKQLKEILEQICEDADDADLTVQFNDSYAGFIDIETVIFNRFFQSGTFIQLI